MKVIRTVAINPVEAAPISMRAPAKVALTVDFQYLEPGGNNVTSDVAAQLQLVARTDGRQLTFPVPATDIVNGKARCAIPKDTLLDMNGYRVRLVGTYRGDAYLLGLGIIDITEAAGFDEVPEDIIDSIPITIAYDYACAINIQLWQDVGKETPFDLSTATITAAIYESATNPTVLLPFTVGTAGPGVVVLQLSQAQVNSLPRNCWWALRASSAAGVTTLAQGSVTLTGAAP